MFSNTVKHTWLTPIRAIKWVAKAAKKSGRSKNHVHALALLYVEQEQDKGNLPDDLLGLIEEDRLT